MKGKFKPTILIVPGLVAAAYACGLVTDQITTTGDGFGADTFSDAEDAWTQASYVGTGKTIGSAFNYYRDCYDNETKDQVLAAPVWTTSIYRDSAHVDKNQYKHVYSVVSTGNEYAFGDWFD